MSNDGFFPTNQFQSGPTITCGWAKSTEGIFSSFSDQQPEQHEAEGAGVAAAVTMHHDFKGWSMKKDTSDDEAPPGKLRKLSNGTGFEGIANCSLLEPIAQTDSSPAASFFDPLSLMREPLYEFSTKELEPDGMAYDIVDPAENVIVIDDDDEDSMDEGFYLSSHISPVEKSNFEKAWAFVEEVTQIHRSQGSESHMALWGNESSFNQLFPLVEKLLKAQTRMLSLGRCTTVDIGFHYTYTAKANLKMIRDKGLLSKAERDELNVVPARFNGSCFGDGIYTGNNPFAFGNGRFGNICLLVARLRGNETPHQSRGSSGWEWQDDQDTRLVRRGSHQMVILRSSSQCLPLMGIDASMIDFMDEEADDGVSKLYDLQNRLQVSIDAYFNGGVRTQILPSLPTLRWYKGGRKRRKGDGENALAGNNTSNTGSISTNMPVQQTKNMWANMATVQQPVVAAATGVSTSIQQSVVPAKERFLVFFRVLTKSLESNDPALYQKVKDMTKDWSEQNIRQAPGYESGLITQSMRIQLKKAVGDACWNRSVTYTNHLLALKYKQMDNVASVIEGGGGGGGLSVEAAAPATIESGRCKNSDNLCAKAPERRSC